MDAFHRLSQLSSTVKERVSSVWRSALLQFERGLQWLKPGRRKLWAAGISSALVRRARGCAGLAQRAAARFRGGRRHRRYPDGRAERHKIMALAQARQIDAVLVTDTPSCSLMRRSRRRLSQKRRCRYQRR
jgi:hypothetical protein